MDEIGYIDDMNEDFEGYEEYYEDYYDENGEPLEEGDMALEEEDGKE